jgi:hypothetical protein
MTLNQGYGKLTDTIKYLSMLVILPTFITSFISSIGIIRSLDIYIFSFIFLEPIFLFLEIIYALMYAFGPFMYLFFLIVIFIPFLISFSKIFSKVYSLPKKDVYLNLLFTYLFFKFSIFSIYFLISF